MKLSIEQIAEVSHDINADYSVAIGQTAIKPWAELPEEIRQQIIQGVETHLANPAITPEESHNKWMQGKAAEGWSFGETKDLTTKKHPSMVPWAELPVIERLKDVLFKSIVASLTKVDVQQPIEVPAAAAPAPAAEPAEEPAPAPATDELGAPPAA